MTFFGQVRLLGLFVNCIIAGLVQAAYRSGTACRFCARLLSCFLGLSVFIAVKTNEHDAAWAETFARATRAIPEIQGVYRTSGDLDYIIRARVPDMAAYDALYQNLIKRVRLTDVSASFVMQEIKETTAVPLGYAR